MNNENYADLSDRQIRRVQQLSWHGWHNPEVGILVGRKAAPNSCGGGPTQLPARGRLLPVAPGDRAVDHAQQRVDREPDAQLLPGIDVLPGPAVHADLATLVALAMADDHRSRASVEVGLGERERLADPQPRNNSTISAHNRTPLAPAPAVRITAMISSTVGGSAG